MNNLDKFQQLGRRVGQIDAMPEELQKQLQLTKKDELELRIIEVIGGRFQGMATIDEVLVGVFENSQVIHERRFIASKLYRMVRAEHLFAVKKRKGTYTTDKNLVDYFVVEDEPDDQNGVDATERYDDDHLDF